MARDQMKHVSIVVPASHWLLCHGEVASSNLVARSSQKPWSQGFVLSRGVARSASNRASGHISAIRRRAFLPQKAAEGEA